MLKGRYCDGILKQGEGREGTRKGGKEQGKGRKESEGRRGKEREGEGKRGKEREGGGGGKGGGRKGRKREMYKGHTRLKDASVKQPSQPKSCLKVKYPILSKRQNKQEQITKKKLKCKETQ